ncbi:rod shape-determining protein MreD [Longirhabdus pacifica]|uniref:rod shape-determining protein MreD n=1 Tax=Longirhabdus pacifica TaxID=2305227 RepID=UPI001008DBC3|nr:rod shape-determining protein MreD [Longirhabdus pacifica]
MQLKILKIVAIIWVAFLAEGTLTVWILPSQWDIAHHWTYVLILMVALYQHRYFAIALACFFGFLHDVLYYGHMLGTYTFAMAIGTYFIGWFANKKNVTFYFRNYLLMVAGIIFITIFLFFLYKLFQVHHLPFYWAVGHYILPTVIYNALFAAVIMVPFRNLLGPFQQPQENTDK